MWEVQSSFKSSLGKLSSYVIVQLIFLVFTTTFKKRVSAALRLWRNLMRCPKSERNFDAFTSSSAAEQKESTFT